MQSTLAVRYLCPILLGATILSAALWISVVVVRAANTWQVQTSPNPGPAFNEFNGVTALSSNDVFAAGSFATAPAGTNAIPLIEQMNGSIWAVNTTPPLPRRFCSESTTLNAITSAGQDVWAVGACSFSGKKLIEHFGTNGTWQIVSAPDPACTASAMLNGAAAISSTNVWAVGFYQNCQKQNLPLTLHWNGMSWTVVPAPAPPGSGNPAIRGVAASATNDVWMVGFQDPGNAPIIEHWNGTAWSLVPSPGNRIQLNGVTAVSSTNAWAVGTNTGCTTCQTPVIEHWDGTAWTMVSAPSISSPNLTAVAAASSTDVWAVGYTGNVNDPQTLHTLTLHWDGTNWSVVASPSPDSYAQLFGVSALANGEVWAVGASVTSVFSGTVKTLVLQLTP